MIEKIRTNLVAFLLLFVLIFAGSLMVGEMVRDELARGELRMATTTVPTLVDRLTPEEPVRISIPILDIETTIANPVSTDVAVLDNELLKGAVHYPGSARLGERGNVLIFGHSSSLPVVRNQAFKAFNDIQNLREGDIIEVFSESKKYTFTVETSEKKSARSTDEIVLESENNKLTLVTCNNFASKSDRFVVTATLQSVTETP